MEYDPRDITQDELDFIDRHTPEGFEWVGGWKFKYNGDVYDLSAADLWQIGEIVRQGLFKVAA